MERCSQWWHAVLDTTGDAWFGAEMAREHLICSRMKLEHYKQTFERNGVDMKQL